MGRRNRKKELQDQALAYLQKALSDAEQINENAEDNFDAYMMKPYGTEVDGRSAFVTSDVSDTVEWIMPSLMKLFYGGQTVCEITPVGPEDEGKAKPMQSKVNYDFMKQQNGYMVLYDWFKSALLNKIAPLKYYWETETKRTLVEYEGLTQMEVMGLQEDPEIDTDDFEVEAIVPEEGGEPSFNVKTYRIRERQYAKATPIPPEEFVFMVRGTGEIADSDFVGHRKRVHKSHLKSKYKLSDRDLERVTNEFENGQTLKETRFEDLGGVGFLTDDTDSDFYFIYECYMNDYDSKGNKVPMVVTIFGNEVISMEDNSYGRPCFCTLSSVRIPHRTAGMSVADMVYDLQRLHTSLVRAVMDNIYYQNNGIQVVNPYRLNLDDVIDRKEPGATWRTLHDIDPSSAIHSVQPAAIAPQTLQMMEVVQQMREKRSGVSEVQQGLDPNTLNNNKTGAVGAAMTAAQQRIELIARTFAETGVADLFKQFVYMQLEFMTHAQAVRVDEDWQEISPRDIDGQFDVTIDVGVGTGTKDIQINQLVSMIQMNQPAQELGVVTGENLYNQLREIYSLMGYKNPDKFVSNPGQMDPRMQQMHQQYEQQIQQLQQTAELLNNELMKQRLDKSVDLEKIITDRLKLLLDERKAEAEMGLKIADVVTNRNLEPQT